VRAWFAKRVCVLGAESTGTTTLARSLAESLGTSWTEEYGREYSELKLRNNDLQWRTDEFTAIAKEQTRREEHAARQANRILICDTNAFATVLWHRRYMGSHSHAIEEIARSGKCDLYLLTGDEIPFVQDGLRDGQQIRHEMHRWFEGALATQAIPWKTLRGSHQERMRQAFRLIEDLFRGSAWLPRIPADLKRSCEIL
jgi:NadR type nicotinamide-nucleotide adenylyltransferase